MFWLSILCVGCGERPVFDVEKDIQDTWSYDDALSFSMPAADTTTIHQLQIVVDHTLEYPYQNLYVKMDTEFPSGRKDSRLVNIDLADKAGNWFGSCGGSGCRYEGALRTPFSFSETGKYKISLAQHTRSSDLPGIKSIGVQLFRTE